MKKTCSLSNILFTSLQDKNYLNKIPDYSLSFTVRAVRHHILPIQNTSHLAKANTAQAYVVPLMCIV